MATVAVQDRATTVDNFEKKERADGEFMFNLLAADGSVLGTSEGYKTVSG